MGIPMRVLPLILASCVLTGLLAGCVTVPPEEDPVQLRLNDLDTRLGRIERVVNNQSLVELSRRIDTLEAELRALRGATDELQNTGAGARKQQRDVYADLDRRITQLEQSAQHPESAAATASDQEAYERAFETLKGGDYAAATTQFQEFMQAHPQSRLLDNAQYWLGETYYVTRDYDRAAEAFRTVGERWPDSRKAPDALLKLGYTQQEQKRPGDARTTLGQVVQRFPGTDAAKRAAERLQQLGATPR
jgi:tol-pal system protein YbgF